jgi:OmpA-OmpF porin, OOP family
MAVDLFELASGYLNSSTVSKIAGILGESPSSTQKAVDVAVPALAGVACNRASTPSGASDLMSLVTSSSSDPSLLANFGNHLSGGSATENLLQTGGSLVSRLLGGNAGSVGGLIASASGISGGAASSLLSLIAPLFLGMLGRQVSSLGLSASGLSNLLSSHRDTIQRLAPPGLANALGVGNMANLCGAPAPVERPVAYAEKTGWPKWLLLIPLLALLLLLPRLRSCSAPSMPQMATITLPCGTVLSVEEGSFNYTLANFLLKGSDSDVPKRIVFDHLNFDSATTQLTPESNPTVRDLIAILKCYPNTQVLLEGHTDNTGDPDANKKLSMDRANAIKDLLVQGGVDPSRISTDGWGQEKPIAPNETDEGRAKNRRTELIVTKR